MPQILADYLAGLTVDRHADDLIFSSSRAESGRVYQMNSIFARCVERARIAKHVTSHTM
ncbi:hypothetical protein [Pseudoxanthomonas mexicana]|uniref:hypothetical protein n=1 Tax=Pseudoxanthomonas mexicana TaxID=128785 RepID=UPI00398A6A19